MKIMISHFLSVRSWPALARLSFIAFLLPIAVACNAILVLPLAAQDGVQEVSSGQVWTGRFTGGNDSKELLRYKDGSFYLSTSSEGDPPNWRLAGTIVDHSIGKGGFYVTDLEGAGLRSTITFFDPQRQMWFWGVLSESGLLSWTPVGENVAGKIMFHVGDGPFFAPVDQIEVVHSEAKALGRQMSFGPSEPLVYPVVGTQKTNLARSQHMETNVVIFESGDSYATTRVWEDTWLAGFHGAVLLAFLAEDGRTVLWTQKQGPIGVTGTWWGHSDVTVSNYLGQVPPELLPFVKSYAIAHMWEPNWLTALGDVKGFFDLIVGIFNDAFGLVKPFLPTGK